MQFETSFSRHGVNRLLNSICRTYRLFLLVMALPNNLLHGNHSAFCLIDDSPQPVKKTSLLMKGYYFVCMC